MAKKIPNPHGKKGKDDHQNYLKRLFDELFKKFGNSANEGPIDLLNGKKRYADAAALSEDEKPIEIHQVGRTNKNGTPVSRERKAIEDIEKATGLKVIFHPLVILAIIGLAILYLIQQ